MKSNWFGLTNYDDAYSLQIQAVEKVRASGAPEILGFEHPATVTLGHRARFEEESNFPATFFEAQSINVVKTDRGGMATLHSPGQLVIYPIIPLKALGFGVRDFLCLMECTTKAALADLGIQAQTQEQPGLYTENGKIAFFGFRIDRGVSRHGISVNVCNDLSLFKLIRPCGLNTQSLDQTAHYSPENTQGIFNIWLRKFEENIEA